MVANTVLKKYNKKYKCPYCDYKFDRDKLAKHIDKFHKDMIPEGYSPARVAFNAINKKETGRCIICHKESPWNEDKQRYERLCGSKSCHDKYLQICENRMKKKYNGKTKKDFLNDPKFQDKMLKGRSISGKYTFENGVSIDYVGSYEKNFLEFMDKFLHVEPEDIQAPGPTIEYMYNGIKHFWITDFYYVPYNLVLDIKDGGKNPNKREMDAYREKQVEKEKAIQKNGKFNYLRLTDNQFDQLLDIMLELKESLLDLSNENNQGDKILIKVNESVEDKKKYSVNTCTLNTIISETMLSPDAYLEGNIEPIENEYYKMSVNEAKENVMYLDSALVMLDERCNNYLKMLEGAKPSYDFYSDCILLKKYKITENQIMNLKENLLDLRSTIINLHESEDNLFDQIYLNEETHPKKNMDPKNALSVIFSCINKSVSNKNTLIKGYGRFIKDKCTIDIKRFSNKEEYDNFLNKDIQKAKVKIGEMHNISLFINKEIKIDENNSYPIKEEKNLNGLLGDAFLNIVLANVGKSLFNAGYDISTVIDGNKINIYFKRG